MESSIEAQGAAAAPSTAEAPAPDAVQYTEPPYAALAKTALTG